MHTELAKRKNQIYRLIRLVDMLTTPTISIYKAMSLTFYCDSECTVLLLFSFNFLDCNF